MASTGPPSRRNRQRLFRLSPLLSRHLLCLLEEQTCRHMGVVNLQRLVKSTQKRLDPHLNILKNIFIHLEMAGKHLEMARNQPEMARKGPRSALFRPSS